MKERLAYAAAVFGKFIALAVIVLLAYVIVAGMVFRHSGPAHLLFGKTGGVVSVQGLSESGYLSEDAVPEPPQPDSGCSCPYCCGVSQSESL